MYCQHCGQQNPDGTLFCSKCGRQNTTAQAQQIPQQPPYQQQYQHPYQQPTVKPKKKKGCLIVTIAAVVLAVVLIGALIAGGGSCSFTTAQLTDAATASSVDPVTMQAINKTRTFSPDTPVIYATAQLKNAPEDTLITAQWYYVTEDIDIASVDLKSTETNQYVSFSLSQPTNGFPLGDYEVALFVDGELSTTLKFSVK